MFRRILQDCIPNKVLVVHDELNMYPNTITERFVELWMYNREEERVGETMEANEDIYLLPNKGHSMSLQLRLKRQTIMDLGH